MLRAQIALSLYFRFPQFVLFLLQTVLFAEMWAVMRKAVIFFARLCPKSLEARWPPLTHV